MLQADVLLIFFLGLPALDFFVKRENMETHSPRIQLVNATLRKHPAHHDTQGRTDKEKWAACSMSSCTWIGSFVSGPK